MHSTAEGGSDETSTEIHAINPSDLSLTRDPRMERESFGFPLGFTPRHYWQRMPGWEQVSRTLTRDYTFDINRTSISESTHNLRLRVAPPSGGACTATHASRDRRLPPCNGWSLSPRSSRPSRDVLLTRHQQGLTGARPSRPSPRLWPPDGTGVLGHYPGLHTRLGRTQPRMPGRGRASGTGPG